MKKRLVTENVPIYGATLVISNSFKKVRKHTNGHADSKNTAQCLTIAQDGKIWAVIYIPPELFDISTVCHESLHAAYRILDHVGVGHCVDNHEALAYLTDYIAGRCWEFANGD